MAYTVQEGESGEKRDRVRRLKLQLKHHIRAEQGLNKNTVQTHNEVDPNYTWSRERVSVILTGLKGLRLVDREAT